MKFVLTAEGFFRDTGDCWYFIVVYPAHEAEEHQVDVEFVDNAYRSIIEAEFDAVEFIETKDHGLSGTLHTDRIFTISFRGVKKNGL